MTGSKKKKKKQSDVMCYSAIQEDVTALLSINSCLPGASCTVNLMGFFWRRNDGRHFANTLNTSVFGYFP
jgi:hypothetical protein